MFSTFEQLYRFAINVVSFLVALILFTGFVFLANAFSHLYPVMIPILIIGLLISIFISTYLHILFLIPMQLNRQFDVIKNKVALRQYKKVDEFQHEIADFLISFFRFPGANVIGGNFHFKNASPINIGITIHPKVIEVLNEENNKTKLSRNHHAFFVPIELGGTDLGKMIIVTQGFTLPIFKAIIKDFENLMMDDQLLHVINQTDKPIA